MVRKNTRNPANPTWSGSCGKRLCQRLPKKSPRVPTRTTAGELAVETVETDDYDLLLLPV